MVKAVLVTHGFLGAELVRTAEGILGPQDGIAFVSNSNSSLENLSDQVRQLLSQDDQPMILMADLLGGSCSHACQEIRRLHTHVVLISGVNLPMLLEFFHNRDRVSFEE